MGGKHGRFLFSHRCVVPQETIHSVQNELKMPALTSHTECKGACVQDSSLDLIITNEDKMSVKV